MHRSCSRLIQAGKQHSTQTELFWSVYVAKDVLSGDVIQLDPEAASSYRHLGSYQHLGNQLFWGAAPLKIRICCSLMMPRTDTIKHASI